ncbi:MAG: GNAT family N-acetyltransferase [Lentilactobacillus diolivorans]|uniref:GNAT family N-acetyltransferase n=1 Tax=Lentilactobacillus diolivorans TaxID=179838 RepID=UPI0039E77EB6
MLRAINVSRKMTDYHELKQLYLRAFPKAERIPLPFLRYRAKKADIDFYAYYDDDSFVGLTYLISYKGVTYILFLAVNDRIRSKGYGSQILKSISENYPHDTLILIMEEVVKSAPNYQQRLKRQSFYFKNGFRDSGHTSIEYGVKYQMLVKGENITAQQYRDLFKYFVGSVVYRFFNPEVS